MKLQNKLFIGGLLFLVAVSVIVHWQWIVRPGILTKGDWWYLSNEFFTDVLSTPKILNGFDDFTIGALTPMFTPILAMGGLLTFFGRAFPIWERLFFLWPIAILGVVPMYVLLYRKFGSVAGAIAGTLVYAFNSYIIARETSHLYIVVAYLILAPLLFIAVDRLLRSPSFKNGFFFTFATIAFSIYEIRILYIFTLVLIAYGIYQSIRNRAILSWRLTGAILVSIAAIILVQSYWLLPFIFAHSSLGYASFSNRGLFQSFSTIFHTLALTDYSWNGSRFVDFATQPIARFAYGIPLLAFFWIIAKPRKEKSGDLWFWTAVACVGIFLAKQANPPFTEAYAWIFHHIPGFQLFRDASKFYLYIGFAYAILIGATVSFLEKRRKTYIIAPLLLIIGITVGNTIPLVRGSAEVLTTSYEISAPYLAFNKILEGDLSFGRSLWIPSTDRFVSHSQKHPRVSAASILYGEWNPFVQNTQDVYSFFSQPNVKSLLNFGSIAYVATPFDTTNGIYPWYNRTQNDFSSLIREIPGLYEIASEKDGLAIWKNNEAKPHLYISNDVRLIDNSPLAYSGSDEQKSSATIFKKDISSDRYSLFQKTLATNWEVKPFDPENIFFKEGRLQTSVEVPLDTELTTLETYAPEDTLQEVYAQQVEETVILFTKQQDQKHTLAEIQASDTAFLTYINGKSFPAIHTSKEEQSVGIARLKSTDNQITVYKEVQSPNLVENPSFEQGVWGAVGDCNNSDGTSPEINRITASLSSDVTNGQQSLQLSAGNHIGCVQSVISRAENATLYTVAFDYKHISGEPGIIKILPSSPTLPQLVSDPLGNNQEWSKKNISFFAPDTEDLPFSIYLHQPGSMEDQRIATSLFDNFDIRAYERVAEQSFDIKHAMQNTARRPFEPSDLEIQPPYAYTPENLITDGTFQQQTTYEAGDCANVDQSPVEENGIKATISKLDGERSLVLKASKHLGCIGFAIDSIDLAFDYLLSVRYRSIQGSSPAFAFYPQQNTASGPQEFPKYNDSSWHTFKKIVHGKDLTKNTLLMLYTSISSSPSEVAFADIELIKIPILPERYIASSRPSLPSLHETIETINPTLHIVRSEPVDTARLLVLSDRYNSGWKLFVRSQGSPQLAWWRRILMKHPGVEISKDTHIIANAFVNGWELDPEEIQRAIGSGTHPEFVLEYWPQRFMDIGTTISFATLLVHGVYIGVSWLMYKKTKLSAVNRSSS